MKVCRVTLNGTECGESWINALAALGHGVPIALVTGDQVTMAEIEPFADLASWVQGAERNGTRSVRITGEDPLEIYRSFVAITCITRVSEGR